MADIDKANPTDSSLISAFPANERGSRGAIETILDLEHDGDGTSATGRHKFGRGSTTDRDNITVWETGSLWINTSVTPNILQMNIGNQVTPNWIAVITVPAVVPEFTSGTLMLFQQTNAPTGWTKETTHDNKAIRIVTGGASSGGAASFTSVFGSGKTTGSHTLSTSQIPAHTHTYSKPPTLQPQRGPGSDTTLVTNPSTDNTGSTGGGSGHTHTLSLNLQYVEFIIAQKD